MGWTIGVVRVRFPKCYISSRVKDFSYNQQVMNINNKILSVFQAKWRLHTADRTEITLAGMI
jgi:hypothetical protein